MNSLKLVHKDNDFLLEINNTKINGVSAYSIKANASGENELTVTMSIDKNTSSIDIE